jgi:hypothetical protein
MVLKSVHMDLATEEVPIRFLKDREGRLSHHKRSGWFSPFAAAWINLRAMFVYGANFFLYKPGFLMLLLGLLLLLPLSAGELTIGPITFSLYWMLLGVTLGTLGLQCIYFGVIAQVFFDYTGERTRVWFSRFPYNRTVAIAAALFVAGLVLTISLIISYVHHSYRLVEGDMVNHLGVTGLFLLIAGFTTFTFTLILHSTAVVVWRR